MPITAQSDEKTITKNVIAAGASDYLAKTTEKWLSINWKKRKNNRPGVDGHYDAGDGCYEAMRRIRKNIKFKSLPIIANYRPKR